MFGGLTAQSVDTPKRKNVTKKAQGCGIAMSL